MFVSEVFTLSVDRFLGCILWNVNKCVPEMLCQSSVFAGLHIYYKCVYVCVYCIIYSSQLQIIIMQISQGFNCKAHKYRQCEQNRITVSFFRYCLCKKKKSRQLYYFSINW